MPKPTQAEVADLVGRLRRRAAAEDLVDLLISDNGFADAAQAEIDIYTHAADAIEALTGEGAEPVAPQCIRRDGCRMPKSCALEERCLAQLYDQQKAEAAAPPAKPAGELPMQIEQALEAALRWHQGDKYRFSNDESARKVWADQHELLTDALRALRERA